MEELIRPVFFTTKRNALKFINTCDTLSNPGVFVPVLVRDKRSSQERWGLTVSGKLLTLSVSPKQLS